MTQLWHIVTSYLSHVFRHEVPFHSMFSNISLVLVLVYFTWNSASFNDHKSNKYHYINGERKAWLVSFHHFRWPIISFITKETVGFFSLGYYLICNGQIYSARFLKQARAFAIRISLVCEWLYLMIIFIQCQCSHLNIPVNQISSHKLRVSPNYALTWFI